MTVSAYHNIITYPFDDHDDNDDNDDVEDMIRDENSLKNRRLVDYRKNDA